MRYFSNTTDLNKGCLIIAEIGVNHNGDVDEAKRLITLAKRSGSDAVKFQTWMTVENTSIQAKLAQHQKSTGRASRLQFDLLKQWELNLEQHREIKEWADKEGIVFFSKPGSPGGLEILRQLDMPMIKIGSPDLTNLPLIKMTAECGLPIILSTGMGSLGEIETALEVVRRSGNNRIMLMQCTSSYPSRPEDSNLRAIETLSAAFGLPVGFSDHSLGMEMCIAAVALGAVAVEKHFTSDSTLPGADHSSSMEPEDFAEMVRCIRNVEKGMGDGVKRAYASEKDAMDNLRRSLVVLDDLKAGAVLTTDLVGVKRPGTGLSPAYLEWVIGKKISSDMARDQVLNLEDFLSK